MEINVNHSQGTVSIWLSRDDQKDEALQAWLKEQFPKWKEQKLLPVVFRSGKEDLYDCTLHLLKYNRTLSAQKEVAAERAAMQGIVQ